MNSEKRMLLFAAVTTFVSIFYSLQLAYGNFQSGSATTKQIALGETLMNPSNLFFPDAKVVAQEEKPIDSQGRFERVKIVETDFKYPFIRIVETIQKTSPNEKEHVLDQKAMVADQVIVKLTSGNHKKNLELLNQKYGATILQNLGPDTYLLKIKDHTIESLPKAIDFYGKEKGTILFAEPNYIAKPSSTAFHS